MGENRPIGNDSWLKLGSRIGGVRKGGVKGQKQKHKNRKSATKGSPRARISMKMGANRTPGHDGSDFAGPGT